MATLTEADTCRKYVLPKLYAAGWTDDQISEQKSFTDGRIVAAGAKPTRRPQKTGRLPLEVPTRLHPRGRGGKADYKNPGDGLQQAKDYAQILGLKFAYATNGHGIVEHDFLTGKDNDLETFPTPEELWHRLQKADNITPEISERVLAPYYSSLRQDPPLLPGDRDQPGGAGDTSGQKARPLDPCHRHGKDRRRLSDLLEALELALE